jgi:glycosyltransferase involved in cell wall biosynthesis
MHIVVFPGWYPSKVDILSGDFIQRHMQAIAKNCHVTVVFPVKDGSISKTKEVIVENGNLSERYYYYPSLSSIKWLDNLLSFLTYHYLCIRSAKTINQNRKVDIAHLYVLQKNHLLGPFLKRFFKIPYVVSEQSTLYVDGRFEHLKKIQKSLWRFAFKKASSFHAVSKFLLNSLKEKIGIDSEGIVIPNVVDADLFYYNNDLGNDKVAFVHVSNLVHQKNVEGMLQAFSVAKKVNGNFILNLVGPMPSSVKELITELGLEKHVAVWNERNYREVATIMQQSDVFVFFTRYETFGCVIIEANACGLPLIVSDLPVTRELVTENFNGIFVKSENVKELSEKILYMIEQPGKFDPIAISLQTRKKFNYEKIGKQFVDWYNSILKIN